MVDISFETLGGLCTVAFLESIDRHIQGQHLFKRSVILVRQAVHCINPAGAFVMNHLACGSHTCKYGFIDNEFR